jgi:hypothetical protein
MFAVPGGQSMRWQRHHLDYMDRMLCCFVRILIVRVAGMQPSD